MFFYTNAVGDGLLMALGAFDRIRRARYVLSVGLQLKSGIWQWKLRVTDGVRDPEDALCAFSCNLKGGPPVTTDRCDARCFGVFWCSYATSRGLHRFGKSRCYIRCKIE